VATASPGVHFKVTSIEARPVQCDDMASDLAYTFGPFQLQVDRGALLEGDKQIRLGNRALEILIALVERAAEVAGNQELIGHVWPGTFVDDSNLRVHLGAIRKALHDGQDHIRYILNVPGRGYRFVAPVVSVWPDGSETTEPICPHFDRQRRGHQEGKRRVGGCS